MSIGGAAPTETATDDEPASSLWYELGAVSRTLAASEGLLVGLDFDGTLTSIEPDPDEPSLPPENRATLRRLAAHDRIQPAVISGRKLSDLRARVDVDGVAYAGNHGLELHVDGRTVTHPIADRRREDVADVAGALADAFASIPGCFVEDKTVTATVHYRRAPAERVDWIRATVAETVDRFVGDRLQLSTGKDVFEIGPAVRWDKGSAIRLLSDRLPASWRTCYLGDDTTDEHAFRALHRDELGIHVGHGPTAASLRLADPAAVELFLRWLDACGSVFLERASSR